MYLELQDQWVLLEAREAKGGLGRKEPEDHLEVLPYQEQKEPLAFLGKQGCRGPLEEMEYLGCQEPRVNLDLARTDRLDKKERGVNQV